MKKLTAFILIMMLLASQVLLCSCQNSAETAKAGEPSSAENAPGEAQQQGTDAGLAPELSSPPEEEPQLPPGCSDWGVFLLTEEEREASGGVLRVRRYDFPDGSSIEWCRLTGNTGSFRCFEEDMNSARLIYTRKTHWKDHGLGTGSIPDGWIFVEGDPEKGQESFLLFTPRFYELLENGAIRAVDENNGSLDISPTKTGYALTMDCPAAPEGSCCDYMIMRSPEKLVEFDDEAFDFWMPFDNKGVWRWAFDGYYFQADPSYIPSGEGVYTNLPSCYVAGSLEVGLGRYDCAEKLLLSLLHTMSGLACEEGFVESRAVSGWLMNDYGIDCAYYDTRFNSDLAEHCIKLWKQTGAEFLTDYLDRYMDFYLRFAKEDGWEAGGGIFVPDYWTSKEHKKPHTALNHQLAEMSVLYKLSDILERPELEELADRLLAAIEGTAEQWIMEDDNLEYAILPDGSFGFTDYPNLTYNDLFDMQKLLTERGRERSEKLDFLMEHKKIWMDANGVTGYRQ
ncbi:MAG: hypothetical protein IJM17_01985 [Firmicutes bacterium]|nr:hypothetical protein [Bacillota bacterium]